MVTLLNRAFGAGMFTGSLNVLLWLSYVVMLSLYELAFGSYGATFLPNWRGTIREISIRNDTMGTAQGPGASGLGNPFHMATSGARGLHFIGSSLTP
jgi:amino acid transporter